MKRHKHKLPKTKHTEIDWDAASISFTLPATTTIVAGPAAGPATTTTYSTTGYQVGDIISFDEFSNKKNYNIKKIHVARRRAAKKKHKSSAWVITDASTATFTTVGINCEA